MTVVHNSGFGGTLKKHCNDSLYNEFPGYGATSILTKQ